LEWRIVMEPNPGFQRETLKKSEVDNSHHKSVRSPVLIWF